MKKLGVNYPIIFEIIWIVIAILFASVFMAVIELFGYDGSISSAIARILTGIVLLIIFQKNFKLDNAFKGFAIMLPSLLLAVYKIPYHFISGGGEPNKITLAVILIGLAPAIFEEVLFRGIFIHNLKQKYNCPVIIVLLSAALFSFVHLTNMIGMDIISLILQMIMAFVVGVVWGAVYLCTDDIVSVIIAHFAVDVLGYIFDGGTTTPAYFLVIIIILFLFEMIYGLILVRNIMMRASKSKNNICTVKSHII